MCIRDRRELGRKLSPSERLESIAKSSARVVRPIVFGMGIITLVFAPVLTLEGIEGKMFRPMAWTFIFALLGALLVAVFLSPVLSYYFLPRRAKPKDAILLRGLAGAYGWAVGGAIRLRWVVMLLAVALLGVAGYRSTQMGGEFIPRLSEALIHICEVRYNGNRLAKLTPLAPGVITDIRVDVGDQVEEGQILAVINSVAVAQAKSAYLSKIAEVEARTTVFEREQKLVNENIAARRDFQDAQAALKLAELEVRRTHQQLINLGFTESEVADIAAEQSSSSDLYVRAPFAGSVVERTRCV